MEWNNKIKYYFKEISDDICYLKGEQGVGKMSCYATVWGREPSLYTPCCDYLISIYHHLNWVELVVRYQYMWEAKSAEVIKMGRAPCCSKVGLHRGPWTPREDALLTKYIQAHGEGQWRSLPKRAGKIIYIWWQLIHFLHCLCLIPPLHLCIIRLLGFL